MYLSPVKFLGLEVTVGKFIAFLSKMHCFIIVSFNVAAQRFAIAISANVSESTNEPFKIVPSEEKHIPYTLVLPNPMPYVLPGASTSEI